MQELRKDTRQLEVTLENQKPLASWSDGFRIASPDNKYKLLLGGYAQFDGRVFADDEANNGTTQFLVRRARLDVQGTLLQYFEFRLLPDFAPSTPILFDAYVDATYFPKFKLRFGKFKPPVGLERLQSATALTFVERGLPTNLVPNRDFGVQLFGDLWDGVLSYQLALVNGAPDNTNPTGDTDDGKDFAGRIFAAPLRNTPSHVLSGLGFGIAGTYGRERGNTTTPDVPQFRTFGQSVFFRYSGADTKATPQGSRDRLGPPFPDRAPGVVLPRPLWRAHRISAFAAIHPKGHDGPLSRSSRLAGGRVLRPYWRAGVFQGSDGRRPLRSMERQVGRMGGCGTVRTTGGGPRRLSERFCRSPGGRTASGRMGRWCQLVPQ